MPFASGIARARAGCQCHVLLRMRNTHKKATDRALLVPASLFVPKDQARVVMEWIGI